MTIKLIHIYRYIHTIYTYRIIGSPIARASSFNARSKSYPDHVLATTNNDTSRSYRSTKELNPWLYIDYEDELHFDNVISLKFNPIPILLRTII